MPALVAGIHVLAKDRQGRRAFILDMKQPGVQVHPLKQMNGYASFNQVFFSDALVDILVWDERPTGTITAGHADWILSRIAMDGGRAVGHHRLLLVALVREAQTCDPRLAAAAFGYGEASSPRSPVARTLGWLDSSGITT